jgi:hypothetical protein
MKYVVLKGIKPVCSFLGCVLQQKDQSMVAVTVGCLGEDIAMITVTSSSACCYSRTTICIQNRAYACDGSSRVVFWVIGLMFGSTQLTWLYNRSSRRILMTALWHETLNLFPGARAQAADMTSGIITMFVMAWVVLIVVIYRPSNLSRSERQMEATVSS